MRDTKKKGKPQVTISRPHEVDIQCNKPKQKQSRPPLQQTPGPACHIAQDAPPSPHSTAIYPASCSISGPGIQTLPRDSWNILLVQHLVLPATSYPPSTHPFIYSRQPYPSDNSLPPDPRPCERIPLSEPIAITYLGPLLPTLPPISDGDLSSLFCVHMCVLCVHSPLCVKMPVYVYGAHTGKSMRRGSFMRL